MSGLVCHPLSRIDRVDLKIAFNDAPLYEIKEFNDEVIFLHEVIDGAADRSYGIHVAKLAGLPRTVVKRAEQVLETLEREGKSQSVSQLAEDLPLFAAVRSKDEPAAQQIVPAMEALKELNPDNSPRVRLWISSMNLKIWRKKVLKMPFDASRIRPLAVALVRRADGAVLAVKCYDKVKREYFIGLWAAALSLANGPNRR